MLLLTAEEVAEFLCEKRSQNSSMQTLLAGVSGIDDSGKGYVTKRIVSALERADKKCASINIDGWLNLPDVRFKNENPAEHFYHHAIRFEDMFSELIFPLMKNGSVDVIANFAEETSIEYKKHLYHYSGIEVIVLEGIYLFKKEFRKYFDIAIWIDCAFETALERAVRRSQEGLSPDETIEAYQRIYFPAQRIHFKMDDPRGHADCIIENNIV